MRRCWCLWSAVVSVVVVAVQGTVLQCGTQCTCRDEEKPYKHEFTVNCDASTLVQATMTEEVLDVMHNITKVASPQALVSVQGSASLNLHITVAFLQRCRQFALCHLDVKGAGRLVFPPSVPPVKEKMVEHDYVGIELAGVSASEVPAGVFSGKSAAGLTLRNTTVGQLPAGLFSGVSSLHRLHVLDSVVGVMEGMLADATLSTKMWEREEEPVKFVGSTIGLVSSGALRLKMGSHQSAVLHGLSVGHVESGAVQVQGAGEVAVEQCVVARVEAGAVVLQGRKSRLLLQDSWLALQPGALTQLACSEDGHRMDDNHFSVLHDGIATPVSLTANQTAAPPGAARDEEVAARQRLTTILSTVIHPSCISFSPLPTPVPQALSVLTMGKMVQFGVISLLVGLLLGGLMLHCYARWSRYRRSRQSRRKQPVAPQPVIMTQIPEDPIFRDYDSPPPVPPFPRFEDWTVSCGANGVEKSTLEKQNQSK